MVRFEFSRFALLTAPLSAAYHLPVQRRDTELGDFSWIKSYAAIGDSYASGVGSGEVLKGDGAYGCSRYDHSYPSILNQDPQLGDPGSHQFTYLACLGAESPGITRQAEKLEGKYDLITISAGGNDLGFGDIVKGCFYRVWPFTKCHDSLDAAEKDLENDDFGNSITALLTEAKKHLSDVGHIYYTGYGTFFNEETTACNNVSWSLIEKFGPDIVDLNPQDLTVEVRKRANDLVRAVNKKLEKLVTDAGQTFINYDGLTQGWLGRMCDEEVDEYNNYHSKAPEGMRRRWNEMFFKWDFEMGEPVKYDLKDSDQDSDKKGGGFWSAITAAVTPDAVSKNFHPTPITNAFIANLIVLKMTEHQAQKEGKPFTIKQESFASERCERNHNPGTTSPNPKPTASADPNPTYTRPLPEANTGVPLTLTEPITCVSGTNRGVSPLKVASDILDICAQMDMNFKMDTKQKESIWAYNQAGWDNLFTIAALDDPGTAWRPDYETCRGVFTGIQDKCSPRPGELSRGGSVIYEGFTYTWGLKKWQFANPDCVQSPKTNVGRPHPDRPLAVAEAYCKGGISIGPGGSMARVQYEERSETPMELAIEFLENQDGCLPPGVYTLDEDSCVGSFLDVFYTCNTGRYDGFGGAQAKDTDAGCFTYTIKQMFPEPQSPSFTVPPHGQITLI